MTKCPFHFLIKKFPPAGKILPRHNRSGLLLFLGILTISAVDASSEQTFSDIISGVVFVWKVQGRNLNCWVEIFSLHSLSIFEGSLSPYFFLPFPSFLFLLPRPLVQVHRLKHFPALRASPDGRFSTPEIEERFENYLAPVLFCHKELAQRGREEQ